MIAIIGTPGELFEGALGVVVLLVKFVRVISRAAGKARHVEVRVYVYDKGSIPIGGSAMIRDEKIVIRKREEQI